MNDSTLDSFESALLTELRDVVAERTPAPRRRRRLVAGVAAAATAGAAAVLSLVLISPNAAYAVEKDGSGDIVVTIHRLEDADQLEHDLADLGVDASVDYDPGLVNDDGSVNFSLGEPGEPPASGEGGLAKHPDAGVGPTHDKAGSGPDPAEDDPCGLVADDAAVPTVERSGDDYVLTIPADSSLATNHIDVKTSRMGDDVLLFATFTTPAGVACAFGTGPATAPPVQ